MNRVHINVLFFLSLIVLALMTFFVASAQAAPARPTSTTSGGLFAGTFEGVLHGDDGSTAPIALELTQDGRAVTGEIVVGRGLLIDGGNCGAAAVPAATQTATGATSAREPRHLAASADFEVQGISVTIDLDGQLSRDGETLTAEARIDLPWLCGRDPVVTGELSRVN